MKKIAVIGGAVLAALGMMAGSMGQAINGLNAAPAGAAAPAAPAAAADDPTAKLAKLKGLLDQGLITQADYDTAKAEVIKKMLG